MELYSRLIKGRRVWYVRAHFWDGQRRVTRRISTGIRDDGTKQSEHAAEAVGRDIERDFANRGSSAAIPTRTLKQAVIALAKQQTLAGRADATLEILTEKSARLFDHFGPSRMLHEITDALVLEYATQARQTRSVSSVSRELLILGQAFDAVKIPRPAFPELGEAPPTRERALELVEQRKLLAAVAPKRKLTVLAFLQLGVRKSEMWKLTEIDWEGRYVYCAGTKTKRAQRWIPIPEELFAELEPLRGRPWEGLEPWTNIDGELREACSRAQIEPISCNDFRRTYATHMARSGCHQLLLAKFMGTSVRMLDEVYARLEKRAEHHHEAVARGIPRLKARKEA